MKPENQRIAIAQACGWKPQLVTGAWGEAPEVIYVHGLQGLREHELPDYLNDLNAMHEAERVLGSNLAAYHAHICDMHEGNECKVGADVARQQRSRAISATATKRAEAFLRTLNLWTA